MDEFSLGGSSIEMPEDRGEIVPEFYEDEDWFKSLIEDTKAIVVEKEFEARWSIIEEHWYLGECIAKALEVGTRKDRYGKKIVKYISESINKSERSIYKSIQFYNQYPSRDLLPVGKNMTWYTISNKLLTGNEELPEKVEEVHLCPTCGQKVKVDKNIA